MGLCNRRRGGPGGVKYYYDKRPEIWHIFRKQSQLVGSMSIGAGTIGDSIVLCPKFAKCLPLISTKYAAPTPHRERGKDN